MSLPEKISRGVFGALAGMCLLFASQCKHGNSNEIFSDDFDRTELGADWVLNLPGGASFEIASDRAYPFAAGSNLTALPAAKYKEKVTGNFKVSAKFSIRDGTFSGRGYLIGRAASDEATERGYVCGYYYNSFSSKYVFMLGRYDTTLLVDLATTAMHNLSQGVTDTVSMSFDGQKITCSLSGNSSLTLSATDSTYGDGYIGLYGGGADTNYLYSSSFRILFR